MQRGNTFGKDYITLSHFPFKQARSKPPKWSRARTGVLATLKKLANLCVKSGEFMVLTTLSYKSRCASRGKVRAKDSAELIADQGFDHFPRTCVAIFVIADAWGGNTPDVAVDPVSSAWIAGLARISALKASRVGYRCSRRR